MKRLEQIKESIACSLQEAKAMFNSLEREETERYEETENVLNDALYCLPRHFESRFQQVKERLESLSEKEKEILRFEEKIEALLRITEQRTIPKREMSKATLLGYIERTAMWSMDVWHEVNRSFYINEKEENLC